MEFENMTFWQWLTITWDSIVKKWFCRLDYNNYYCMDIEKTNKTK